MSHSIQQVWVICEMQGRRAVPLLSSRGQIPRAPGLAADTSKRPELMSSVTLCAVSKLLLMVVAMTPVGPVFNQPLQYRPGEGHDTESLQVVPRYEGEGRGA